MTRWQIFLLWTLGRDGYLQAEAARQRLTIIVCSVLRGRWPLYPPLRTARRQIARRDGLTMPYFTKRMPNGSVGIFKKLPGNRSKKVGTSKTQTAADASVRARYRADAQKRAAKRKRR